MASGSWRPSPALNELIIEQYARFNVFQLMRLLLRRSGSRNWPTSQRLRFRAELGAPFQGIEISRLAAVAPRKSSHPNYLPEGGLTRIAVHTPNYCIGSELGPLPEPFLEWLRDQQRAGVEGGAMAAFLNVFNQRIHVLRYELKQRSLRALDPALPTDTRYAEQLAALMGLASADQQVQVPLPKRAWLGIAGLLINNRRSADVVGQVIACYLGVTARLHVLVGRWRDIVLDDRIALGRHDPDQGPVSLLGRNSLLGRRMWDSQAGVRLEISRMRYENVLSLLPLRASKSGEKLPVSLYDEFVSLVHLLLDRRFDCDVQIAVDRHSIPPSFLCKARSGLGLRLGQTAWLMRGTACPCATLRWGAPTRTATLDRSVRMLRFRIAAYPETAGDTEVAA